MVSVMSSHFLSHVCTETITATELMSTEQIPPVDEDHRIRLNAGKSCSVRTTFMLLWHSTPPLIHVVVCIYVLFQSFIL